MKVRNDSLEPVTLLVLGTPVDGQPPSVTIAAGEEVEADFRNNAQFAGYVASGVIVPFSSPPAPKPEKK